MNTQGLPVGETIDRGWNTFKKWVALLIGAQLVVYGVPAFMEWVGGVQSGDGGEPGFLMSIAIWVATVTLQLGIVNVYMKLRDGMAAEFADLFTIFPRAWVYLVSSFISHVAIFLGLLLFIVPGIIVAIRLNFIPYLILDENIGPIAALQRSWELTRGYTLDLFLYYLLLFAINILGLIALCVGLFVSIPVTGIAVADMYRVLKERESAGVPVAA
jgi:uncharacterized membrane protein